MHGGASTGRPPTTGRTTRKYRRLLEQVEFFMWMIQANENGSKAHFRWRATPERIAKVIGELKAKA